MNGVLLGLWGLFIVLNPFYTRPNGQPQNADVLACGIIAICLYLVMGRRASLPAGTGVPLVFAALFLYYVFLVQGVWAWVGADVTLKPFAIYLYNVLLVTAFCISYNMLGARLLNWAFFALCLALFLEVVATVSVGSASSVGRQYGSFNNPNQLGYFALAATASLMLIGRALQPTTVMRITQVLAICACIFLLIASASRAATWAFTLTMLLIGVRKSLHPAAMVAAIAFAVVLPTLPQIQATILPERLFVAQEEEDGTRGYDRLVNYPEHLLLGSAEGDYRRFPSDVGSHEIHSSLGTLLFCYGLIGFALFAAMVVNAVRRLSLTDLLYLLPVALYSLTHMGLRFRTLWLLLAIAICISAARASAPVHGQTMLPRTVRA